ncbi:MAG TPA: hypothetical protein VGH28_31065 [Polyangiaceae bacterium]|jgi:hypothetical protein
MHSKALAGILAGALLACSSTGESPADGGVDAVASDGAPVEADAGWAFTPSSSVAELTQNNTSAKGWTTSHTVTYGSGSSYSGQKKTVDGFWDEPIGTGAQSPGSANGRVSKAPIDTLLPGHAVPVFVETQNWWGDGSGHIDNGEVSSDPTQIANQVADHLSRGFAGQIVDWYGQGTTADKAMPAIRTNAEAAGGKYQFAVMIDKGLFDHCGETVTCLNDSIAYLVSNYTGSTAYLKDGSGHPIIFYFINQYYPTEYAILTGPGVNAMGTTFVMYEPNGFPKSDPPNTIGEYGWVNPGDTSATTTTGSAGTFAWTTDFGFGNIKSFFGAAASNPTSYAVSDVHKGFEDNLANWSLNRIIDQRCGQTWLQTFHHTGTFGGSASFVGSLDYLASGGKLDLIMVDTWDDYEEGTEIETGIDNCLTTLDVTLSGTTLAWTPTWGTDPMDSSVTGTEDTLFRYSVWAAQEGATQLMDVADLACTAGTCPHSVDLSTLGIRGGPYVFYVQAVGMPSIVSTLGGPTATALTR